MVTLKMINLYKENTKENLENEQEIIELFI